MLVLKIFEIEESVLNKNMCILIVDDFLIMCCIVKNLLGDLGFINMVEVEDGYVVLVLLQSQLFDFVVIDWNMLVMIGIDLFKVICVDVKLKILLVLMVMVEVKCEQIIEVVQFGVNGYIIKLFIVQMLEEKFGKIFECLVVSV